ncbi:hypothetical protein COW99_04785 [Candidatus Roizmanbacteria bacterium CG22_combo_CG10-13_8_21_14_all_38_20]|uniref:TrpR, YerC/YecD n=1 Tax=Candidatus Roizmanbacteria bacterium CG22_combo_CG10-13_8_21_14_all_38_20 TaxID=1974862 RepID=A0A2H0BUJ9_9BACT|nr:hypothetical protein [Candidatus Microgenomates bacterium]PIP61301.1 MAG: hypothetical protein COW99_04785 [Candidatus Roizmanbacteria bacterium CG22_combo_CG10-13_8_21_14_all_38_20]PJC30627.1 MAG: hypothetical protein CO050_05960 [Candidatus Roizmanbacteria bacterium CG_4_9_14_0_2_um_filter_38_17]
MKNIKPRWVNSDTDNLFEAILRLEDTQEAHRFFRDLLTEGEIMEFAARWKAARMLNSGIPYSQIQKETGLSSTTVARVSQWLTRGMSGYQLMLDKLHHSEHVIDPAKRI